MGFFSKRMNRRCNCWYALRDSFYFGVYYPFPFLDGTQINTFRHYPEGIGFIGMLINFAVAFSVVHSRLHLHKKWGMVENIHIPSGSGKRRTTLQ